jgi:hypothetical protein
VFGGAALVEFTPMVVGMAYRKEGVPLNKFFAKDLVWSDKFRQATQRSTFRMAWAGRPASRMRAEILPATVTTYSTISQRLFRVLKLALSYTARLGG